MIHKKLTRTKTKIMPITKVVVVSPFC